MWNKMDPKMQKERCKTINNCKQCTNKFKCLIDNRTAKYLAYGMCPTQCTGEIDGFAFYFRARCDDWTFRIANKEEKNPVSVYYSEQGFCMEGEYEECDYMEEHEVFSIIKHCSTLFRKNMKGKQL